MSQAIHQFVPNFAAGDAIGTHVRHTQRALRAAGYRSEIFYDEVQPALRRLGRHYSTFDADRDGPCVALFQLSTGSAMTEWLLGTGIPFGVYFHNVTPPSFFERWEPNAAENLRRALSDVRRLAPSARFALANSTFSAGDLERAGYSPIEVVPVLIDDDQPDQAPNAKVLARLRREQADRGARWLFVGRVAPNKCQHDLIAAFAAYRELHDRNARLSIVGGRTANVYYRSLELLTEELGVADAVELADSLPEDEKLAHWHAADVYVSSSEHEGFAVPLIEALRFRVPVVAFASSAVPETLGDAGVLLDDKDPVVVAEAVRRVLHDSELRAELETAGKERADRFAVATVARELVGAIRRHVDAAPSS